MFLFKIGRIREKKKEFQAVNSSTGSYSPASLTAVHRLVASTLLLAPRHAAVHVVEFEKMLPKP